MNSPLARYLPWGVVTIALAWLVVKAMPPQNREGEAQIHEFGRMSVVDRGRVKPMDTLARTTLMILSGRQTFRDSEDRSQPAIKWLLGAMTGEFQNPKEFQKDLGRKVFHIEDTKLIETLKLGPSPDSKYSAEELKPVAKQLMFLAREIEKTPAEQRPSSMQAVMDLAYQFRLFAALAGRTDKVFRIENDQVLNLLGLKPRSGFRYAGTEFAAKLGALVRESRRAQKVERAQQDLFDRKILEFAEHVQLYYQVIQWESLLLIPPRTGGEEWLAVYQTDPDDRAADILASIFVSYQRGEISEFNQGLEKWQKYLAQTPSSDFGRTGFEVMFNHFAPFYQCIVLYIFVFILAFASFLFVLARGSWAPYRESLNQAAFWLAVVAVIVHTWALLSRMYIQGRPPVTNLYSSAVFIGWAAVLLALSLEWIFRNGLGNVVGAFVGATTLIIAHYLSLSGDTLEMMQAVLDTNFWLATHVTTVTLGYTATFVAGCLGVIFVVLGVFTRLLDKDLFKILGKMIYGVICFAMLLSFTGTVLGGIWADQSWGRFWGWDTKENGALMIVLWNALILHARWGGIVQQRGMAVLAIAGNIVTTWSWFGVNMLSVGLHNYGFIPEQALWTGAFVVSQLVLIGIGLMPMHNWKSLRAVEVKAPVVAAPQAEPKPRERRGKPASTAIKA
jgi:ABC-type transport system involved in cytochrome c biogenesis permease subunit